MLNMKWSEYQTLQFVKTYFNHEHLWNNKHLYYKSKDRRLSSYHKISKEFRLATGILLSLNEVKVKIKNLKSTYSQELTKIKQRSNSDYKYEPAMKWFSHWHKHYQKNLDQNAENSELEESNATDEGCQQPWLNTESDNVNEDTDVDPFESHLKEDFAYLVKSESNNEVNNESSLYNGKRKKFKQQSLSTDTSDNNFRESLDLSIDRSIDTGKDDEFDTYGKFVAAQLRTLTLQKALSLQLEIQSLISEARLTDLSNR